ncbi:Unknown protein [Striga hermonthica]|uniref:Peptidase C1A papain C-terminal domain-containing protein n=1 Tax=Striga hermonthica TaxID=68872 RepID=A0A9N7MX14_STRHE|nr:Unknown protein [Striga hermonthica]
MQEEWSWTQVNNALPPPKDQTPFDLCEMFSHLTLMEIKLRQSRTGDYKGSVGSLSTSHVMDWCPEGANGFAGVDIRDLNARIARFLEVHGVAFEHAYGPQLPWNPERFRAFERRRRNTVVKISPGTGADEFDIAVGNTDHDSLRRAIRRSPLLASIRLRVGFEDLGEDEMLPADAPYDEDDGVVSLHTCVLTGFGSMNNVPYYEMLNSWGPNWGRRPQGIGRISVDDILSAWDYEVVELIGWCSRLC